MEIPVGDLIDQLITANIKIFFIEERLESLQKQNKTKEVLEKIAKLDAMRRETVNRRRMLINELNKRLGEKIPRDIRTFEVG
ncbi:MAG: hypothetical protein J7J91_00510 [Deltaproteobacteria bacterium]|nr:hypothetical protein [Deltaproteobacteria bacterium]